MLPTSVRILVCTERQDMRRYAEPVVMRSCSLPQWSRSSLGWLVRPVASSA
jgi:hypothetical protein